MPCDCVDVDFGSYANTVALYPPEGLGITRVPVTVDRCIAEEILELWEQGILTLNSCCGHNKIAGCILVADRDIPRMKELGHTAWEGRPECFYPNWLPLPESAHHMDDSGRVTVLSHAPVR